MAKLTEKQIEFLKKHNMWNVGKDKSNLNLIKESQFKDFDQRREKLLAELAKMPPDQRRPYEQKLQAADDKAKKQDFKGAYHDLKQVKQDARREANGYVDSLSLQDIRKQLVFLSNEAKNIVVRRQQLIAGQNQVLSQLAKEPKAASFNSLAEASEFRRDFKQTEVALRSQVTGLNKICGEISGYYGQADIEKRFEDINFQIGVLEKEKGADVGALKVQSAQEYAKFTDQGKLLTAGNVKSAFQRFSQDFDARIKDYKDLAKFQQRDPGAEKISDQTLGRAGQKVPGGGDKVEQSLSALLRELSGGPGETDFDKVVSELKAVEKQLAQQGISEQVKQQMALRKKRAVDALDLLDQRDAKRFMDAELGFLVDSLSDAGPLSKTQEPPKRAQPLATFDADTVVSDLNLPPDLKNAKAPEIQQVRQQVKAKMEQLLDQELRKPNSDLVFDLGLKTKEEFVQQLAGELEIDLKNKKCSQAEKDLVDQMAEQMLATVKEKFPNKAGAGKMNFTNKFDEKSDAPTEFQLGNTKYTNPKYLSSGGLGDVLRYEEKDSDPKKYMVLKSLKKADKRDDMVRELKMHRQANGGETGTGNPNVVDMKGAIQGQNGELFMAVDYAEGGDLKDLGTGMTQAMQTGALSEEARQVLTQHLLRQAVLGMKHVQDSNMTHHDIKGQNFLIGADGKVKVADFGSAQVGDDEGKVPTGTFEFTGGFQAPEVNTADRITGKADTYTLGVMLNNMASPIQGEDAIASKWTSSWEFKSKQGVTALDKLKNAMLSKKPEERPTLEAVMQTTYMTDSSANYEPEKIDNLMTATMAYNKNVAGKTRDDMERILRLQGLIVDKNKEKRGAKPEDAANLDKEIAKYSDEIKECRAKIDKVLAQDDVKPYVAALQKANAELTGRGAEGEKLDVSKLKFKDEYEKIAQTYKISANNKLVQTLIQALTAVDQASDAVTKKQLAETARKEAKTVASRMTEIAASAPEETKLKASQLGSDLRKLVQALEEAFDLPKAFTA
jgi:serine/threonine protein kinase